MENNEKKELGLEKKSFIRKTTAVLQLPARRLIVHPWRNRYARLYQERTLALVSDLLVIVGMMVLFVALILFWNHPLTSNRHINLDLAVDQPAVSGGETEYTISWQNNNRNTVVGAYLVLLPPAGWEMTNWQGNGFVYDSGNNLVNLGDLLPGARGEVKITGWLWTDIDRGTDWEVRLYYNNLGILHNKTLIKNFVCNSSLLVTNISLPAKIYASNIFPIQISLTNNSGQPLAAVQLRLHSSAELTLFNQRLITQTAVWEETNLLAGEKRELNLFGRINELGGDAVTLVLETSLVETVLSLKQGQLTAESIFIHPQIDLSLNLPAEQSYYVGEQYSAQIYYYNREDYDLSRVEVRLVSNFQDFSVISTPVVFNWDKLDSQAEGSQTFYFTFQPGDYINDYQAAIWAELSWQDDVGDTQVVRRYVFSPRQTISVSPDLNLLAKVYYYTATGDQIGYGPLPPAVGEDTSYWISLRLWPSFGKINDLNLTAALAPALSY
jgi:hypothetical protein